MFFLGLFLIILGIFGIIYPFLIYPAILFVLIRIKPRPKFHFLCNDQDLKTIPVSIVFCAYNEQASLPNKIDNIRELQSIYSNARFMAYSDGSTDNTNRILDSARDIVQSIVSDKRCGKSLGMNRLISGVDEDFVIFTDANVTFEFDTIIKLLEPFEDNEVGVVCGSILYERSASSSARINRYYWQWEEKIKHMESRVDTSIGADGSIFAIRRRLFRIVPQDIIDDFFTSLSIICDGYRCIQRDDALVYEAQVKATRDEFQRKIRIACRAFNCHRLLWPRLRQLPTLRLFMYMSHKIIRWFSGFFVAVAVLGTLIILIDFWGLALSMLVIVGAAGVVFGVPLLRRTLFAVGAALIAPTIGVIQSLRGVRYATWQPAASGR